VRGAQALSEVKAAAKMTLSLEVSRPEVFGELATILPRGGLGTVEVLLKTGAAQEPRLRLGRDFLLDGELTDLIAGMEGVANVSLKPTRAGGHLRLVA
jgi:DNA polymerase-3 subunit alpha